MKLKKEYNRFSIGSDNGNALECEKIKYHYNSTRSYMTACFEPRNGECRAQDFILQHSRYPGASCTCQRGQQHSRML